MLVKLDHTQQLSTDIVMFWFKSASKPQNIAGQFIELFLPHKPHDKRGEKRWFTLSSSPTEELMAITTRHAAENGSTFKEKLFSLEPGYELDMSMPMGDFTLQKDQTKELVFVAGGIGITPFRSMVKNLSDSNEHRNITLIHAVNTPGDLIFKELFESYGLKYMPVIKSTDTSWQGETGVLDSERIINLAGGLDNKQVYLSGPEPMIEALAKGLTPLGVPKNSIVTDYFPGYTGI